MKKIFLILITIITCSNIYAKEYILDEKEIISYEELSDKELISTTKLYNTYEINKKYTGYQESCDLYDKDDYTIISELNNIERGGEEYYTFTTNRKNLNLLSISDLNVTINEIEIYNNNYKKVNYKIIINNNDIEDNNYLNDANYSTYYKITNKDSIMLVLNDIYDSLYFKIITNDNIKSYRLSIGNVTSSTEYMYTRYYTNNNLYLYGPNSNIDQSKNYYLHTKKLYNCYIEEKNILNEYVEEGNNTIEDDFIIQYKYKDQLKVEIDDTYNDNNFESYIKKNDSIIDIKYETYFDDTITTNFYVKYIINNKYNILHMFNYSKVIENTKDEQSDESNIIIEEVNHENILIDNVINDNVSKEESNEIIEEVKEEVIEEAKEEIKEEVVEEVKEEVVEEIKEEVIEETADSVEEINITEEIIEEVNNTNQIVILKSTTNNKELKTIDNNDVIDEVVEVVPLMNYNKVNNNRNILIILSSIVSCIFILLTCLLLYIRFKRKKG